MNVAVSFKSMALLWDIFTVNMLSHDFVWNTNKARRFLFEFLYMTITWTLRGTVLLNEYILSICGWFFSFPRDIQGPGIRLPEPTCGLYALGGRLAWPIGEEKFPSILVLSSKCRWPFITTICVCWSSRTMFVAPWTLNLTEKFVLIICQMKTRVIIYSSQDQKSPKLWRKVFFNFNN